MIIIHVFKYTDTGILYKIFNFEEGLSRKDKLYNFAPCKGIRNPESSKFLLLESGIQRLESGIHNGFGIRNPEGWNPESKGLESRIQMLGEAGIRNPGPSWILLHGANNCLTEEFRQRLLDFPRLCTSLFHDCVWFIKHIYHEKSLPTEVTIFHNKVLLYNCCHTRRYPPNKNYF